MARSSRQKMNSRLTAARWTRREALAGMAGAGVALAWSAAGSRNARAAEAPQHRLDVIASEFHYQLPASTPAGYTAITLHNQWHEPHHAIFMRLHPGTTTAAFLAAAKNGPEGALFALADAAGGPGTVDPGQSATAIVRLDAGTYVVICIVPDAHDMPHYKMGMLAPLNVTPAPGGGAAPHAEATIDLVDFSFRDLPQKIASGRHVWKVINTGTEIHEMSLNRLVHGHTFDEVKSLLTVPHKVPTASPDTPPAPPFTALGGSAPMAPGAVNWAEFNFQPADYFAICYVPDPASGRPHFDLGMIRPFTVA